MRHLLIFILIFGFSSTLYADIDCSKDKPMNNREEVQCKAELAEAEYQSSFKKLVSKIDHLISTQKNENKIAALNTMKGKLTELDSEWRKYAHSYCYFDSYQYSEALTGTSAGPMEVECFTKLSKEQSKLLDNTYKEIISEDDFN